MINSLSLGRFGFVGYFLGRLELLFGGFKLGLRLSGHFSRVRGLDESLPAAKKGPLVITGPDGSTSPLGEILADPLGIRTQPSGESAGFKFIDYCLGILIPLSLAVVDRQGTEIVARRHDIYIGSKGLKVS